jgi:hypothetical protein
VEGPGLGAYSEHTNLLADEWEALDLLHLLEHLNGSALRSIADLPRLNPSILSALTQEREGGAYRLHVEEYMVESGHHPLLTHYLLPAAKGGGGGFVRARGLAVGSADGGGDVHPEDLPAMWALATGRGGAYCRVLELAARGFEAHHVDAIVEVRLLRSDE